MDNILKKTLIIYLAFLSLAIYLVKLANPDMTDTRLFLTYTTEITGAMIVSLALVVLVWKSE